MMAADRGVMSVAQAQAISISRSRHPPTRRYRRIINGLKAESEGVILHRHLNFQRRGVMYSGNDAITCYFRREGQRRPDRCDPNRIRELFNCGNAPPLLSQRLTLLASKPHLPLL